jgi:streptogramin lyase
MDTIWWSSTVTNRIHPCPPAGCPDPYQYVFVIGDPSSVIVDGGAVFWLDDYSGWVQGCAFNAMCPTENETTLVEGLKSPRALVADDGAVYWADVAARTISSAPRALEPTTAQLLADGLVEPWSLAVDATDVYFTDRKAGVVGKVAKAGGPVTNIASGQAAPWGIAVGTEYVYWTNAGDGTVSRSPK